ncbi:MAG: hypothetical protein DRO90_02990 [Candidatus Altiarchaeales archaeon]|nr:MAG: hypothetical protein DRO95_04620 [Candidatus Altiarchaeales archaeon]RLI93858.1 MAG: hypothetical protein DRO90_02990 [Candidatus Altiarchaeales archaeon]HDO81922.1 CBS domain-containing protein [Candidatus Altiarchaeales archaeon]HEX54571.1 CBS domain-containing protein [Candidatus Altiarchaeales archaeon]
MHKMLPELSEIRRIRKRLGMTQTELARMANVSQSLIARIENGAVDPKYSNVMRIFKTLNEIKSKELCARDIMTPNVVRIQMNSCIGKAAKLMRTHNISQLPVFDGNRIIGSISEQSILDKVSSGIDIEKLSSKRINELMEEPFPIVGMKTPLSTISLLLGNNKAVLVVEKGEIRGIITNADLLKVLRG